MQAFKTTLLMAFVLAIIVSLNSAQAGYTSSPPPKVEAALCPLALTKWIIRTAEKDQKIEVAQNSDSSHNGTGVFPSVSLARVTLAPCGVRTMHAHANVDELLYIVSGRVSASTAFANGTICEQGLLKAGDSFMYQRNLVHSARNKDCKRSAVVLGFFTAFDSATIQIAPGAYRMPGGPFNAYADSCKRDDIAAAVDKTTLAYDPLCLERCGLGEKFGQSPAEL